MNQPHIPATRNDAWGFWGTMGEQAEAAWPIAMRIVASTTGEPLDSVRAFLDSRHGRHFADQVMDGVLSGQSLHEAIHATARQWIVWRIGKRTGKDYGVPSDLPYLTGFVVSCAIVDEIADESAA